MANTRKCKGCGGSGWRYANGKEVHGFDSLIYKYCNSCGWSESTRYSTDEWVIENGRLVKKKKKKLKVYGGAACINGSSKQHRVIVAAYSKKEAIELLNATCRGRFTYAHFADYWCDTGNAKELATATTRGVWYYTDLGSRSLLVCITTKQDPTKG